jgi:hypothetical protein
MNMIIFDGQVKRPMTDAEIAEYNAGTAARDAEYEGYSRGIRNKLLTDSDWTQIADAPLTDAEKASWQTYRTSLRDLPDHANWPKLADADWPTKP